MLGVLGAGVAAVVFGLVFVMTLLSFLGSGSASDLFVALGSLGFTGLSAALFDLTNNRQR
jgi:hypothetical protein